MNDGWFLDWLAGLLLIVTTIMVHALGLVLIGLRLEGRIGRMIRDHHGRQRRSILHATLLIGVAGWLLAILHGIDAGIWAIAYRLLGAIASFHAAVLYSVDCMATLGNTGVAVREEWSLLGPLEAANGMLLFGVSTAFLFTVMARIWQKLLIPEAASEQRDAR